MEMLMDTVQMQIFMLIVLHSNGYRNQIINGLETDHAVIYETSSKLAELIYHLSLTVIGG
jgi:hypothetical protein